jgi:hypothetical protein
LEFVVVRRWWIALVATVMLNACNSVYSRADDNQADRQRQSEDAAARAKAAEQVIAIDDATSQDVQNKRLDRIDAVLAADAVIDAGNRIDNLENEIADLKNQVAEMKAGVGFSRPTDPAGQAESLPKILPRKQKAGGVQPTTSGL